MRVAVIINPISGRFVRRARARVDRESFARAWLATHGVDADVAVTARRGHAAELSRRFTAQGFDRLVAWGGDGTANEVAGPLIGSHVGLGLVRAGSGDGLARGLGVPEAPAQALDLAVSGSTRRLDVGWLGTRHFLNVAGCGFDAAVARAFNASRSRGVTGYIVSGLAGVWSYRQALYDLRLDGFSSRGRRFLVAFANGTQYGNGMILAPAADPADGFLDAVIVDAGSALRQLWRGRRLFQAPHKPAAGVTRLRIQSGEISGAELLCHVDGEVFETSGNLEVKVTPGAISIVAASAPVRAG
jgi:YegS/Rv2252/BmrU family lipid kinase